MSIGSTLAQARESAGLTLEDVAAKTRIRRTLILGIEDDDFSACGGDFYARGHLRTVATAVGADPAQLLAEFDAQRPEAAPPRATDVFEPEINARRRAARPELDRGDGGGARPGRRVRHRAGVLRLGQERAPMSPAPTPRRVAPARSPSASSPSPTEGGGSAVAQAPRGKVTVVLRATDRSWVQVTTNTGQELFQGLLQDGQQKTFTDKSRIKLVIGNAGAVDLTVNGTNIGAPGRRGQVARVQFTPEDPAAG